MIVGIDPGSRATGFGVIQSEGPRLFYLNSGVIRAGRIEWPERLKLIYEGLCVVLETYQPHMTAIEKVFVHRNPLTALKLGQARGTALTAVAKFGLPVHEYTPRTVKKAIVGYGAAEKQQVQQMIRSLLQLKHLPAPDAADALAVAVCHAHALGRLELYNGLGRRHP